MEWISSVINIFKMSFYFCFKLIYYNTCTYIRVHKFTNTPHFYRFNQLLLPYSPIYLIYISFFKSSTFIATCRVLYYFLLTYKQSKHYLTLEKQYRTYYYPNPNQSLPTSVHQFLFSFLPFFQQNRSNCIHENMWHKQCIEREWTLCLIIN